jgi:hypothetical protein
LGDLVEFDPMSLKETTLEVVKHRFNTAQRETLNSEYTKLYYDEIYADHTDGVNYGKSNMDKNTQIIQWKLNDGFANLAPEGYIYNPHHKIKIGEFSNIIKQSSDTLINVVEYEFNVLNGIVFVDFKTELNYGFLKGDVIGVLEYGKNILHKFRIVSETLLEDKKRQYIATAMTDTVTESTVTDEIDFFKHDLNTPLYAYMLPDKTGRHIWREVVKPSEITFNSDLYNIPFTNNAFYHHINVDFPVRRQDPFGEYNMSVYDTLGRKINVNFEIAATKYDITYDEYDNEVGGASCF